MLVPERKCICHYLHTTSAVLPLAYIALKDRKMRDLKDLKEKDLKDLKEHTLKELKASGA
jgi:hypothetical protein